MPAIGTPLIAASHDFAVNFAAGGDARQDACRNATNFENFAIPREGFEIHQLGPAGVRHVGDVDSTCRTAGELPQKKRVNRSEQEVAGSGFFARVHDIIQDPADFQRAEISGERKASLLPKPVGAAIARQFRDGVLNARVLPDDGVVDGPPVLRSQTIVVSRWLVMPMAPISAALRFLACMAAAMTCCVLRQISCGIVLDPAGPRVNLQVFALGGGDDLPGTVEDDEARAGGALVNRADVRSHSVSLQSPSKNLQLQELAMGRAHDTHSTDAVSGRISSRM